MGHRKASRAMEILPGSSIVRSGVYVGDPIQFEEAPKPLNSDNPVSAVLFPL